MLLRVLSDAHHALRKLVEVWFANVQKFDLRVDRYKKESRATLTSKDSLEETKKSQRSIFLQVVTRS